MKRIFLGLFLLAALTGCHSLFGSDEAEAEPKAEGKRIAVLEAARKPEPDKNLGDTKLDLPAPAVNKDWPQAGGNAEHAVLHAALSAQPKELWHADIGRGSSGDMRLLAQPVIGGGKVYALDSRGEVSAFSETDGKRLWHFDTTPPDQDDEAMGGGLALADNALYVTTGFGEVLALKTSDGSVVWRKRLGKPFRGPPTVSGKLVFAVAIDNELDALSTQTGQLEWHHNGIAESATLMGGSSPAVAGESVVVTYSSGEIFNLRAPNGRLTWTDVIAVPEKSGALPAIADIRGLPVVDRGRVFAISHSGRMAAIDLRSGERAWEADVGGINTPCVAGNAVFVIDNTGSLLALMRDSGRILWVTELQKLKDPTDRDSKPVFWWGPVLAGGRLWLTNSLGGLASFQPEDGKHVETVSVAGAFFIPPVVAGGAMYLVSDDGQLIAMK